METRTREVHIHLQLRVAAALVCIRACCLRKMLLLMRDLVLYHVQPIKHSRESLMKLVRPSSPSFLGPPASLSDASETARVALLTRPSQFGLIVWQLVLGRDVEKAATNQVAVYMYLHDEKPAL